MNLALELQRRESFAASDVRVLSREEIRVLQLTGRVTPMSKIPYEHFFDRRLHTVEWRR